MYKLVAAIPAEQHFGFDGRLSRRTDLRLSTFSYCYFFLFFFLIIFIFLIFVYWFVSCLLFYFCFACLLFFLFLTSFEVILVPVALLGSWPGLMYDLLMAQVQPPPICKLYVFVALFEVPCPSFYFFP